MPVRLIHHPSESSAHNVSPFDEAIVRMVQEEDVLVACPYLSLRYLMRIFHLAKSVSLLTDAEEWLASHASEARHEIRDFLIDYVGCVHHVKDLHSKVIIAGDAALVGSANFTHKGITSRIEMGVLLQQEHQVDELKMWFQSLWARSSTIVADDLDRYLQSLPTQPVTRQEILQSHLTSSIPPIRSQLAPIQLPSLDQIALEEEDESVHKLLVDRVRLFPSRMWADSYFDLMRELMEAMGVDKNDPRLVTSIPRSAGRWLLPVTINNRYVLAGDTAFKCAC